MSELTDPGLFERAECFGAFLGERKAWPPREVQLAEHTTIESTERGGEFA